MKVLHITTTDYGGAYRAVARINESMIQVGVDSRVLVRSKLQKGSNTIEIFDNPLERVMSKVKNGLNILLSSGEVISDVFGTDITRKNYVTEADVIILHWVNSFISYRVVQKLADIGKPIIWVMHDMWLITGGCHCDQYCNRFQEECGYCPYIRRNGRYDVSYRNLKRKEKLMQGINVQVVTISRWMQRCGRHSTILRGKVIERIPNPIDSSLYRTLDNRDEIRKKYGIPTYKKVIMFGALKATSDVNKGIAYLEQCLNKLEKDEYLALVFGNSDVDAKMKVTMETRYCGVINSDEQLVELYNLADVFVAPSQQDNYPNTVLEALSCGTPVTAFAIGGMTDLIEHKENGYLAEPRNTDDLADGIRFCAHNREVLSNSARQRIVTGNNLTRIGNQYKGLCERVLHEKINMEKI